MKQAKRRHGMAFYIIEVFVFAIEFMLGVNAAFLVDQSISIVAEHMLAGTGLAPFADLITLVASLAVGFCFVAGGMWTFTGFMTSLEDAQAYQREYATRKWPTVMVWALLVAVVALDATTLAFRAAFFAEKGATALFAFFAILIFLPPILGPLVHVLEHTPRVRRLSKIRQFAETLEVDDAETVVKQMDPDLRSRLLAGDTEAVEEHYARVAAQRQAARQYELQKVHEREEKRAHAARGLPFFAKGRQSDQARLRRPNNERA